MKNIAVKQSNVTLKAHVLIALFPACGLLGDSEIVEVGPSGSKLGHLAMCA